MGHNTSLSQRSFKEILILPCYFRFSSSFIVLYHLLTSPHAQRNITSNICIIYSPPDILYTLRFCYIIYFVVSQIYSGKNFLKDGCYFRQVISTVAKESLITSNLTQRTVETEGLYYCSAKCHGKPNQVNVKHGPVFSWNYNTSRNNI